MARIVYHWESAEGTVLQGIECNVNVIPAVGDVRDLDGVSREVRAVAFDELPPRIEARVFAGPPLD